MNHKPKSTLETKFFLLFPIVETRFPNIVSSQHKSGCHWYIMIKSSKETPSRMPKKSPCLTFWTLKISMRKRKRSKSKSSKISWTKKSKNNRKLISISRMILMKSRCQMKAPLRIMRSVFQLYTDWVLQKSTINWELSYWIHRTKLIFWNCSNRFSKRKCLDKSAKSLWTFFSTEPFTWLEMKYLILIWSKFWRLWLRTTGSECRLRKPRSTSVLR